MRKTLESLKSNLWFYPASIVLIAIAGAQFLIQIDKSLEASVLRQWPWISITGADGAREMLSTIAGSIITVTGVAFSITIVVLAMASNQYSPRVLRNFMGDWRTQFVLGGFLGIFSYCILVLRTVRGQGDHEFVPSLAVFGSVLLAFVGVSLLIYFIHHVANSIRASNIIKSIFDETTEAIENLLDPGGLEKANRTKSNESLRWSCVQSIATGYIQSINTESLLKIAKMENFAIRLHRATGDFAVEHCPLLSTSIKLEPAVSDKLLSSIKLGPLRTLEQDIAFGLRQLVDIALKGLSPGVNDTTTAVIATQYLGALMTKLSNKQLEPKFIESEGRVLIELKAHSFTDLLDLSFDQIRQNGSRNPALLSAVVSALEALLHCSKESTHLNAVFQHLNKITFLLSKATPRHDYEATLIEARRLTDGCMEARRALGGGDSLSVKSDSLLNI